MCNCLLYKTHNFVYPINKLQFIHSTYIRIYILLFTHGFNHVSIYLFTHHHIQMFNITNSIIGLTNKTI